jgi:hypothetical protein
MTYAGGHLGHRCSRIDPRKSRYDPNAIKIIFCLVVTQYSLVDEHNLLDERATVHSQSRFTALKTTTGRNFQALLVCTIMLGVTTKQCIVASWSQITTSWWATL